MPTNRRSCEVRLNSRPLKTVEPRLTYRAAGSKTVFKGWRGGFAKVPSLLGNCLNSTWFDPYRSRTGNRHHSRFVVRTLTDVFASSAVSSFRSNVQTRSRRFRRFRFRLSLSPGQSLLYQPEMRLSLSVIDFSYQCERFSRRTRPKHSGWFLRFSKYSFRICHLRGCDATVDLVP